MVFGILLTVGFLLFAWLVFFKFKLLKFSIPWAMVSLFVFVHVLLIFLIGIRFMTPATRHATVVQHTIQLVPRLPEPTLVTEVLVEPDVPVKKGQPLFQFDKRPYEYQVRQLEAQLAGAVQNVKVLKADLEVSEQNLAKARSELVYAEYQQALSQGLANQDAGPKQEAEKWKVQVQVAKASIAQAQAEVERSRLNYESDFDGVNTSVAALQAELDLAKFYLENTTMYAPEDGYIVNLQVRPGMVAGILRAGAIASFICDADRYMLATYFQEDLKYVSAGQPVEVALNLYPGQIFQGKVEAIWKANGDSQYLPSGHIPRFEPRPPDWPQNCYAVKITFNDEDQSRFPIGAQGATAIYTGGMKGGWAALRRISLRTYSWMNWLYPLPF
jgi:multidrug resistance efflux pump